MKFATAFLLTSLAAPTLGRKANKNRRAGADKIGRTRNLMSKSSKSCHVNDFSSYDISFEEGEIQVDFDFDVNCKTPEVLQGCCRKLPCGLGSCPGGGKQCIRDGGVWIADDGSNGLSTASFNCCDPKLFEDLLNSDRCVVDGSRGTCYDAEDDCSPVRYNSYGGDGGASSGVLAGIAGCDREAVDEIVATADTCEVDTP